MDVSHATATRRSIRNYKKDAEIRNEANARCYGTEKAEEVLQESEQRYRELVDTMPQPLYELDERGTITFINREGFVAFGYSQEDLEKGLNTLQMFVPQDRDRLRDNIHRILNGEEMQGNEYMALRKDGTTFPILAFSRLITRNGKTTSLLRVLIDITERKRAEEKLREGEERFRELAENIREVFYIYEQDMHQISYISPAYMEIWGRTCESLYQEPKSIWDNVHPEDKDRVMRSLEKKSRGEVEEVYRIVRPDGSIRWIKDRSFPIYDNSGKTHRIVGIAADITDLKFGEEKLKYLSLHDPLTGLYNRIYFEEEMSRIEKSRYDTVGIISCDVDGLKLVNDTLGHNQGDNLLVAAAGVIQGSFREGDLIARIGGDEFSVVLPNTTEPAVENACQRIQEAVASYNATNPELPLSISVGFAVSNGFHRNLKDVFK